MTFRFLEKNIIKQVYSMNSIEVNNVISRKIYRSIKLFIGNK